MAAYITVLNYVYSLCVFYYSVLSCVADVADCPLQRLSAIVIKNIIIIIIIIYFRCLCYLAPPLCMVDVHLTNCVSFFFLCFGFLLSEAAVMQIKMYI